jgi:succinate-semialdehyde dehydrogenase/glutarate-semialdehyde dehydrogenase
MNRQDQTIFRKAQPPTENFIDGKWSASDDRFDVLDKFDGTVMASVAQASLRQVTDAVDAASRAFEAGAPSPTERAKILLKVRDLLIRDRDLFTDILIGETGFTLADASNEVDRALVTLELCAEEGKRIVGDLVPFGCSPGHESRIGFTMRFPLGVICAITPFNSPLNTVLHKVGPAFAAGNSVILKPSALTPLTSALLCDLFHEAGTPSGFVNLVQGQGRTVGTHLLADQRISFYAFTGSTEVGRVIQMAAGLRRTQMELGSIASTIVLADADFGRAAPKIANAAFRKAGQVCTSVQMLFVERSAVDEMREHLLQEIAKMPAGNPRLPGVRIGPMISEAEAKRAESWIGEASSQGAKRVCGGERLRSVLQPAIIEAVSTDMKIVNKEAFAPLLSIIPFDGIEQAIKAANSTPYGLSAGVFTGNIDRALTAARSLRFGSIHLNEASSARADVMPFGGVKESGFGHEGPSYAIREMTEERLITLNR